MRWVESENIENFESAGLWGEGRDIVAWDLKVLQQRKGWGEAVCESDSLDWQDGLAFFGKSVILETLDEAENQCIGIWGVNRETWHDSHRNWLFAIETIHPVETVGIDVTILIDEAGETPAEISFQTNLGGIDSFLCPRSLDSCFSAL